MTMGARVFQVFQVFQVFFGDPGLVFGAHAPGQGHGQGHGAIPGALEPLDGVVVLPHEKPFFQVEKARDALREVEEALFLHLQDSEAHRVNLSHDSYIIPSMALSEKGWGLGPT